MLVCTFVWAVTRPNARSSISAKALEPGATALHAGAKGGTALSTCVTMLQAFSGALCFDRREGVARHPFRSRVHSTNRTRGPWQKPRKHIANG